MAEIINNKGAKSKHHRKVLSTRVDLTPMVDLGFLLITFFIITTTMRENHAMKLDLPVDGPPTAAAKRKTVTLILKDQNNVDFYNGDEINKIATVSFKDNGLRKMLQNKKKAVRQFWGTDTGTTVIIKPTSLSNYNNVVAALNEMPINDIRKYVLTDLTAEELKANPKYQ